MAEYPSGDINAIAVTHGRNMEAAGICKRRHAALAGYLKSELEKQND